MSAMAKDLSEKFSSVQLVFFRSAVGLPFLFTSLWLKPAIQKGGKLYYFILLILYVGTPEFILNKYVWPSIPFVHRYF